MPSVHRSILPLVCPVRKRRPPNRRNPDDDVNENDRSTTPRHRFHVPFQRFSTGKCRKGDRSCGLFTTTPSSRHMFSMFGCDTVIKRNGYPPVRMGHFYTRVVAHMTHDEKRRTPPCVSSLVPHRATRFLYCGVVEQAGWHGFDSVRTHAPRCAALLFFSPAQAREQGPHLCLCLRFQHPAQTSLPSRYGPSRIPLSRMLGRTRYSRLLLVPEDWRNIVRPASMMHSIPEQHATRLPSPEARPPSPPSLEGSTSAHVRPALEHPLDGQMGGAFDEYA